MKIIYLLIIATLFSINGVLAQTKSNIVIFSEDGEPFFAFVNGVRQNVSAETNVRITDLTAESFSFRIVFANSGKEPISKNQFLPFGSEYTFKIKTDKKGEMKLQSFGQVELAQATSNSTNSTAYHSTETPVNTTNTVNSTNQSGNGSGTVTTTTTETVQVNSTTNVNGANETMNVNTTTNGQTTNNGTENVSVNMNVGGASVNMNVSVSGTGTTTNENANVNMNVNGMENGNVNSTTTTTTTTTNSSTSANTSSDATNNNTNVTSSSNGSCIYPSDDASFEKMRATVEDKPFSDTKMSTAKLATKNACLSTAQVKIIMELFSMDDDKLAYAKFAYDYTTDRANFYTLSEAFSFDATTTDFNKFLESK